MALSSLKKWTLIIFGSIALGLGLLGIFLPLLPTTVFLLIAAACYARSSDRLYEWLLNHKWFGSYIRNWREHKALTRRTKISILFVLWFTLTISAVFAVEHIIIRLVLLIVGIGVTTFILSLKTIPADMAAESR